VKVKSNIIKALEEMDKNDISSLILFTLYKLKDVPEYSVVSELPYILDNDSFIRFLNYYGGKTIKVPTVEEFNDIVNSILVYATKENDNKTFDEACAEVGVPSKNKVPVLSTVKIVSELLNEYDFKR
jgi:hypothetical protein